MRPIHFGLALLLVLIWGINFIAIKGALEVVPPIFLCFCRFFLTSVPAVFFVKFPNTSFKKVATYGLIIFALQFSLLFLGMHEGVTPGLAGILVQTHVFFSIIFAALFLNEKTNRWQIIGACLAFSGIALVGMETGGNLTLSGVLIVIASAICFATGNVLSKKMGPINRMALVIWGSFIAWPPLLLCSFFLEGGEQLFINLQNISWVSAGSIAYITYLSTLLGFAIWSWLLHHHALPTVAPFTLLVPIIAMASSVLFADEPLQDWKIYAGALVIAGLCINLLGPRFFRKKQVG